MDPVPRDFETWHATPIPDEPDHPELCARRAHTSEFERIYDLVDAAFEVRRPRALYDWLYRRSPLGPARCWTIVERKSGRFVNSVARIPWPFQLGDEPIEGSVQVDSATAVDWRGQNISALKKGRRNDPWQRRSVVVGWPNLKSQRAAQKHGRSHTLLGPLPRCVLPLRAGELLRERGWPAPLATAAGAAADRALAWRRATASRASDIRLEEIRRFEADFDPVTRRALRHDGFWSPHPADFLNWRVTSTTRTTVTRPSPPMRATRCRAGPWPCCSTTAPS